MTRSVGVRGVGLVLAALLAAAGCSGGDDGDADGGSGSTTSAALTTIAESVTPTDTPTDTPTTTSRPTSLPTATTADTPTTSLDFDAELRAVEDAYIAAWQAITDALRDPTNPELRAEVEKRFTSVNKTGALAEIDKLVANGWVARPNPDVLAGVEIPGAARFTNDERTTADLISCETNSDVYFEIGGAPDGSDSLVDDTVYVVLVEADMTLVDGVWLSRSGITLRTNEGPDTCAL